MEEDKSFAMKFGETFFPRTYMILSNIMSNDYTKYCFVFRNIKTNNIIALFWITRDEYLILFLDFEKFDYAFDNIAQICYNRLSNLSSSRGYIRLKDINNINFVECLEPSSYYFECKYGRLSTGYPGLDI